jgi:hypothetical protein
MTEQEQILFCHFKVMDVALLLYKSKCWIVTKQENRRNETAGMRFLRGTIDETASNINLEEMHIFR